MKGRLSALICSYLFAHHVAQAKSLVSASARLELAKGPGTEQCLDRQELLHAVEVRLQRRAFRADLPATLYVHIAIARDRRAWSALLTMHDGSGAFLGRRSLSTDAADCSALDDSLALVVALLVDSPPAAVVEGSDASAAERAPFNAKSAAPEQASPPARSESKTQNRPETPTIRLPRDTPAPRAPWRFRLTLEGSGAIGLLPGFAPGVELGFGAKAPTLPEFRLFAGGYEQREQSSSRVGPGSGARFDFAYIGLESCPLEREFGVVEWFVCAGQSLGRLRVAAFGFDENLTSSHLSYALLLRSGAQIALSTRWAARLGVRAEWPLDRGVFSYGAPAGGQHDIFETQPVTVVLDLGLMVRL